MILQKLLFPSVDVCSREQMYYTGENTTIFMTGESCYIPAGATLRANTYFNSFSVAKWTKYTAVSNLNLRLNVTGDLRIRVWHACKMNGKLREKVITENRITAETRQDVVISLPLGENTGVYYFDMKAVGDGAYLWGGAYETEIDEDKLAPVKIAVGICTFRREPYVAHNMDVLRQHILENENSPMHGHLEVFISDNSKTLPASIATEQIHVFPNRNLGGAGGFTRAMIEIKKVSQERGITHVLLMDDDIRLNPDSLLRTYTMLRLMKPEHRDAFIGGHMLKIDAQNIQSEAADHWDMVTHHPVKYNYDLEDFEFVIKNEVEDSVNYLSWWYCCMPINVVSDSNLPLPIFIKRDDIEYGLRSGTKFVILNGICVWHEPFEYKSASYLEYYYFRNMCIMNSRHRVSFNAKSLIREVRKRLLTFLLRYRYKDAELSLLGVQHYLKGIDWLKKQDGERLNGEIMKLGYKKQPIDKIDHVFTHGVYEKNLVVEEGRKRKLLRLLTLNGWLLKANRNVVVPAYQPSTALFYRANKVINYEEISNTAFITQRSKQDLRYILKMYRQTEAMIKRDFKRVTQEYRDRYDEIINLNFWNEYLFNPGEVPQIKSGLDQPRRPKNNKYQWREILVSYVMRAAQIALFWLPVKKNRVMVYIHDRKGFTCNVKYVVQKLKELYGDKLEILWVTMHPETCQEVEALGVKVLKSNTAVQMRKYLRTRFFITNDAFPSWALHRWNQKWMNTWHGAMNYKHIGYDYLAPMSPLAAKIFKIKNRQPDYFLSGSEFFTKDTAASFRLSEKVFVPCGLPRNDAFFVNQEATVRKVREYYGLDEDKRLAIFAPTFRRGMKSDTFGMDFEQVRAALSRRFGGEWVILFRNHNFVKGKQKFGGAIDVSAYHDMQELMCASDALISDYSSCLYDFCMTGRPSFVYATDLDNYMHNDRSFAYPFEKWPYPVARSNAELVKQIEGFDEAVFAQKVAAHLKDAGAYDNGTASEQVAAIIAKHCL